MMLDFKTLQMARRLLSSRGAELTAAFMRVITRMTAAVKIQVALLFR